MVTVVECPSCGAAHPDSGTAPGLHSCRYCGARYQLDLQGRASKVADGPLPANPRYIAAGAVAALTLIGLTVGLFVVREAPAPSFAPVAVPELDPGAAPEPGSKAEGTSIVVPVEAATPEEVASATFVEHSRRVASDDSLWILGMLTNTSSFATDKTKVTAVLLDAAGAEVGVFSGYSSRDVQAAGDVAPVQILVKDPPDFASIRYEVHADRPLFLREQVEGLRVEATAPSTTDWGALQLGGKVHNDGDVAARFVQVEVQGWSADGKLVGLSTTYVDGGTLAPGGSARWKILGMATAAKAENLELFVTGVPLD